MVVVKFGGSSIKTASDLKKCASLVAGDEGISLIILSATFNTTNLLKSAWHTPAIWREIKDNHLSLIGQLGLEEKIIEDIFKEGDRLIEWERDTLANLDRWYGVGEMLSSKIFASYLEQILQRPICFFDIRRVLITNSNFGQGTPLLEEIESRTKELLLPLIEGGSLIVTQGFIGATIDGKTTTLGREGSDYSATLLGQALKAKEVRICRDVGGVFTADPKLVRAAQKISHLPLPLADIMARSAGGFLFSRALEPLMKSKIDLLVCSSLEAEQGGTWIKASYKIPPRVVAINYDRVKKQIIFIGGNLASSGSYCQVLPLPDDENRCLKLLNWWHEKLFL